MNYSSETKPAKILNLRTLKEMDENLLLTRDIDSDYHSTKKSENNRNRVTFSLATTDINIQPTVRQVICIDKKKIHSNYRSFVIEPIRKSTCIVVVMIEVENQETFFCNLRILPFSSLRDIADKEIDSNLLTINLEKSKCILETDVTIISSDTGESLYSVRNVDVSDLANLITHDEIIELKRELEFQGAKLVAHYFQEILEIFLKENPGSTGNTPLIQQEYFLNLTNDQLKQVISANAISGCIALEIIGSNVIRDLNRDWRFAYAYIDHLL